MMPDQYHEPFELKLLTHPYLRLAQGIIVQAVRDGDIRYLNSIQGKTLMDNLNLSQQERDSLLESARRERTQYSRKIQWNNKTMSIAELSRQTGIKYQVLYDRICIRGWTVAKAVSEGSQPLVKKNYTWNGQPTTLKDISKRIGINYPTLYARIHRHNMPLEQAVAKGLKEKEAK